MIAKLAATAALGICLFGLPARAQSVEACRVLESAYAAAIEAETLVYPVDIAPNPAFREIELKRIVADYRARMPLTAAEFADLEANDRPVTEPFLPKCAWQGAGRERIESKLRMTVSFSLPIFSSDRWIAVTQVSFTSSGSWGHGLLCVARRTKAGWSSKCLGSWIV